MATYAFPAEAGAPPAGGRLDSDAVAARLSALGLPAGDLRIACQDDAVVLEGRVPDAATQERIVLAAGNIQGVARVEDRMVPAHRAGLLEAFAGLANLPAGSASLDAAEDRVHEAAPDPGDTAFGPGGSVFHTVQEGETLEGIAQRHYGMTREVRRILEANAGLLSDERAVRPGMVLRLPQDGRRSLGRPPSTR